MLFRKITGKYGERTKMYYHLERYNLFYGVVGRTLGLGLGKGKGWDV
jgi:hypothetical protein